MALIRCPDCEKEISDKSKLCIHCGCPLVEEQEDEVAQKVEITSLDIKGKNLKKTIVSVIIILAIVIGGVYSYNLITSKAAAANLIQETNDYIDLTEDVRLLMFTGALESELVSSLIHDIWYNTIYEKYDSRTDKYTISSRSFNDDFNDSLGTYFNSSEYSTATDKIDSNQELVKEEMKKLQNPPQGLENVYTTITDMHEAYLKLCKNATNPTGNLSSYTASINDNTSNFMNLYEKIETQLPDKK